MSKFVRIAAALVICSISAAASAQDAGVREHDGFFLQMQYGPSFQSLKEDSGSIAGGGGSLQFSIGGSPVTNLALFGEVSVQLALDPQVDYLGRSGTADAELTFSTVGPGLAWYFGASNIFVSGMLGAAQATIETRLGKATAAGFGGRIGAGKEWWVSDQWGLGVAANLHLASVTDELDFEYSTTAFAVSFSATYQ